MLLSIQKLFLPLFLIRAASVCGFAPLLHETISRASYEYGSKPAPIVEEILWF